MINNTWRWVWRRYIAPLLSDEELLALQGALERDDRALLQGVTVTRHDQRKAPMKGDIVAACALGYCLWRGLGIIHANCLEAEFQSLCGRIDAAMGDAGGSDHFLRWFDRTPRPEMRRELLAEVTFVLEARTQPAAVVQ